MSMSGILHNFVPFVFFCLFFVVVVSSMAMDNSILENHNTNTTKALTTKKLNDTNDDDYYSTYDDLFYDNEKQNIKDIVNSEFDRRRDEIEQMQYKAIEQYIWKDARCDWKSSLVQSHGFYDPFLGGCRDCSSSCPEKDFLCYHKCKFYTFEKTLKEHDEENQRTHQSLYLQVHVLLGLLPLCVSIIIGLLVFCSEKYKKKMKSFNRRIHGNARGDVDHGML
ncbi:unnamed protein product [Clavelina lepadiformis]|uniref:Uncharacterized protein n=1 Tax=Clavelina lepadiformis TaxID=159417 RepID=A0ABP0GMQ8_CLALP